MNELRLNDIYKPSTESWNMTLRCAVIGTGYWGKNLLRNLDSLGALAGFFDENAETRSLYAGMYPCSTAYDSQMALMQSAEIDAVVVATPAATHGALTRMALQAGKHVFVEKPLCLDIQEAEGLAALANEYGKTLMVGHLLLYHPAFIALKEEVESGALGRLRYIYSTRASLGKIRRVENALWSFAPHDVSMILALTGRMPDRISCHGEAWLSPEVADMTLSHFDFGNQLQAHVFVSWLHPFKDHRLVVVGERGMLVFNDTAAGDDKLLRYAHNVSWDGDLPRLDKAEATPVAYDSKEPLFEEMAHFIDCCQSGAIPRSNAREGINVLAMLDACQRSLDSKLPVSPQPQDAAATLGALS